MFTFWENREEYIPSNKKGLEEKSNEVFKGRFFFSITDHADVMVFAFQGKFYNWYNLTIKYKSDREDGFHSGYQITVSNAQGSDDAKFYLQHSTSKFCLLSVLSQKFCSFARLSNHDDQI